MSEGLFKFQTYRLRMYEVISQHYTRHNEKHRIHGHSLKITSTINARPLAIERCQQFTHLKDFNLQNFLDFLKQHCLSNHFRNQKHQPHLTCTPTLYTQQRGPLFKGSFCNGNQLRKGPKFKSCHPRAITHTNDTPCVKLPDAARSDALFNA